MNFLQEFESLELQNDESQIEDFRSRNSHYKSFMSKWNLPVYFQIRFQEIALPVETALNRFFTSEENSEEYELEASRIIVEALNKVWSSDVYLSALEHKFLKLTCQIVSRYMTAVEFNLNEKKKNVEKSDNDEKDKNSEDDVKYLILLHTDIKNLTSDILPNFLANKILSVWFLDSDEATTSIITKCYEESVNHLKGQINNIDELIVDKISGVCLPFLKQVSDIPRLYRRTNKELPSKPCGYLNSLMEPAELFHSEYRLYSTSTWLTSVFNVITDKYFLLVGQVLEAVQKMEDSLKRLKKIRDKTTTNKDSSSSSTTKEEKNGKISDDDKIRLQLFIDVRYYVRKMEQLGVDKDKIDKINELENMVKEVTRNTVDSLAL